MAAAFSLAPRPRAILLLALIGTAGPLRAQPGTRGPVVDSIIMAAERALGEGRPWRATRTVAPLLESPVTRTPEVVLLAARSASGWQGYATVIRLLLGAEWLDSAFAGEGRALLARAMVEQGDPNAVEHARRAVGLAAEDHRRGPRLVVLARAHDRTGRLDSASAAYARAAALLPLASEWLHLRAAGLLVDSARRASHFGEVRSPAARDRIRWTDALASERTGHLDRAARLYEQLGARVSAIRLRSVLARDAATRARLRDELLASLPRLPIGDVPGALAVLDGQFAPLPPAGELVAARRAAAAAMLERAQRGFTRAAPAGLLTAGDRVTWGTVLARLGRHAEAIRQFERVPPGERRAEARYHRARSILRTSGEAAGLAALRRVRDSFPADSTWAATAWWLLADAEADDGRDSSARREYGELAARYPTTSHGERAAFQAGLMEFLAGDHAGAGARFEALARRGAGEATAAWYWAGRAREAAGDTAAAIARWRELVARFPQSYYVVPASRRLGITPWSDSGGVPPRPDPAITAALARAALLDSLGLGTEARFEWDRLGRDASTAQELHALARAFRDAGLPARAMRLAQRALDRGAAPDSSLMRLLYPLTARDVLEDEARHAGVPALLMAGLIRQESAFDPAARSRADARGLMQVLPSVGRQYARREGLPEWDPVLLYQPDVNLHFGLIHFAEARERCGGQLESALAAYNAGPTPVNRWLTRAGTSDPEIFIERIPYVETRDYVRRVTFNWVRYEALYGHPESR